MFIHIDRAWKHFSKGILTQETGAFNIAKAKQKFTL